MMGVMRLEEEGEVGI
jgi:hypothetical protein